MESSDALLSFRHSFYECLHRRGDALFELTDAILSADGVLPSPVHLSLQTSHRRGWGSLDKADLRGADLRGADLQAASLREADLDRAYLRGAELRGAKLRGAMHLTQEQLEQAAIGDERTTIPTDLSRPAAWFGPSGDREYSHR